MLPSNSSSLLDDSGYTSDNSPKKPFVGYDDLQAAIEAWAPKGKSVVFDNAHIGRECETPGVQRKNYTSSAHILRVCETSGGIRGNYYGNPTQETQGNPSYAHKIVHKDLPKKRRGQEDPASLLRCPLKDCNKTYRTPFWLTRHFLNDHGIVSEDPRLKQAITEWRERAAFAVKQSTKRDRRKPQNPTVSTAGPTNYNFQFLPDTPVAWSDSLSNPWSGPLPSFQSSFWNVANSSASLMVPSSDISAHLESSLNPRVLFHQLLPPIHPNCQHVPNQSMVHPSCIQRMSVQSLQHMHLASGYSNYQVPQLLGEFTSVSAASHPIVADSYKREVAEVVEPSSVEQLSDERKKTAEAMRKVMRAISPIVVTKEEETRSTQARSPPLTYTTLLPWKPSAESLANGTPMTALQLIQSLIPTTDGIPFGDFPGTLDYDPFAPLNWGTVDIPSYQPINNQIEEDK